MATSTFRRRDWALASSWSVDFVAMVGRRPVGELAGDATCWSYRRHFGAVAFLAIVVGLTVPALRFMLVVCAIALVAALVAALFADH
jgi:hypothetical protein